MRDLQRPVPGRPPVPQQFDCEPGVLGSKGFTWGKVYWEVEVEREGWSEDRRRDEAEEGEEEEEGRGRPATVTDTTGRRTRMRSRWG